MNVYGPYEDMVQFWESLLSNAFFKNKRVTIGGDLKFTFIRSKICEPMSRVDPLARFFIHK